MANHEHEEHESRTRRMSALKCPRCYRSDMFETGSWSFVRPFAMRNRCPVCDLNFWQEPGFYYGAMFISYGLIAFFSLAYVAIALLVFDWSQRTTFLTLGLILAINFVYVFRVSRAMWLYVNVRHDPRAAERFRQSSQAGE
jgi:endogenous inhibitor of DNA gyrase (YacG/DUF329 family)